MTDIIFISFQFPPLNIGGVFRPLKFAKYLSANDIRPWVYTLAPNDYPKVYRDFNTDEKMLAELKNSGLFIREVSCDPIWDMYSSGIKRFANIFFNIYRGNEYKKWRTRLVKKVQEDAGHTNFKAVVVTAPPFGMLQLANELAATLKLPLIIDMRDAWAYWNLNGYGTRFHYFATLQKEAKYFKAASKVVATSDQTITDWLHLHPGLTKEKFACIPNGYDDTESVLNIAPFKVEPVSVAAKFRIVYVGSFYYSPEARATMMKPFYKKKGWRMLQYYPRKQDWLYRSPYFFFKAMAKVFELEPGLKKNISIVFAGNKQDWMNDMINEFGLADNVEQLGFISHEASLTLQAEADALLITSAKVPGGRDCFIAGKTFEYITMNKPVLAFVADGSQKDLLTKTGLAITCDPDETDRSAHSMIELFHKGANIIPDETYIRSFERKKLTQDLANIIKDAIKETKK